MEGTLKGRTAVITGASRGIGRAVAARLAAEGMDLCISARGALELKAAAKELSASHGVKVYPVTCDVSRQKDLERLADTAIRKLGRVDALVNNAGVSSQSPFHRQPLEDIPRLMQTNYFGYVMLTRLLINHMVEHGGGAVINMVSGSTLVDPPPRNFIVYSSLKWALRAFTKGLFWEMRDMGIKVTSILPGVTGTSLTGGLDPKSIEPARLMSTKAIEDAVVFALTVPANVCPLEISVINQQTPWKMPVIPYRQDHPK
ncbi:MAG TPA: SDR family oxidoreductase [Nitrospirota bacterium]|jgi:short-subunit dehydrogenase